MIMGETISEVFFGAAKRHGNRPLFYTPTETRRLYDLEAGDTSYGQAAAAVDVLIRDYSRVGFGAGSRIGLALENRPDFFLHFIALNSLGASILPLNCAMQSGELTFQIEHSECDLIVVTPAHHARLADAAANAKSPPAVIEPAMLEQAPAIAPRREPAVSALHREAAILYTSGTTGKAKGCILSNEYFLAIGELYTNLGGAVIFEEGKERIITPLPVTHMNALACSFMAAIRTGSCLIQLDRFHPKSWWSAVRESRATIMHYLGVMPAMLLQAPQLPDDDFSGQIKFAFGAGCDPRHHETFEKRFGVKLIEAWAMTETGAGAWITASIEPRHVGSRCFGRAPEGLEYLLIDEEGRATPQGEAGEFLVRRRGANPRKYFFNGYFKDEAATQEAWKDGWFHTGDVVRVDDEGNFYFVDRRKNVIRRSGENIAAIDVESVLLRHDDVVACVVVPVPDEIRGDEVMAMVKTSSDANDEKAARAIFDFAMENLVYFKTPGLISFIQSIPMTASEKINRGEAKRIGRDLHERGGYFDFTALKKPVKG